MNDRKDPVTDLLDVITTTTTAGHAATGSRTTDLTDALRDAVDQLTKPRIIHTEITDDHGHITGIHTEEHPALIDLLERGTGLSVGGHASASHTRIPIDMDALEIWGQIRDQTRAWLRILKGPWRDNLKTDVDTWLVHHESAVNRGRIPLPVEKDILRTVEAWVNRIDAKFDPEEHREWLTPCPAVLRTEGGDPRRCSARYVINDHGDRITAIDLNVTRLIAQCRRCGTRWDGERGLMQLRYESNLWELERAAEEQDQAS